MILKNIAKIVVLMCVVGGGETLGSKPQNFTDNSVTRLFGFGSAKPKVGAQALAELERLKKATDDTNNPLKDEDFRTPDSVKKLRANHQQSTQTDTNQRHDVYAESDWSIVPPPS